MTYMAVRCSSCSMLQVKQMRKSSTTSKWCCAICNEKQSVRKVYSTSDSAKDIRKFVQTFNLNMGLAAQAESMARLEGAADTFEDPSESFCDQEDEEVEEDRLRRAGHAREKNSSKWQRFLPEEEQVCSEDVVHQSADDDKYVTSLPDPASRTRKSFHSSCRNSSPPQPQRPLHGSLTSSRGVSKRGHDSGSDDSTPLCNSGNPSAAPELPFTAPPISDADLSPKRVKSCHAQVSVAPTSKWSKYLT